MRRLCCPSLLAVVTALSLAGCSADASDPAPAPSPSEDDLKVAHVYECNHDGGRDIGATLTYGGSKLKSAVLKKIPVVGFDKEETLVGGKQSTGGNPAVEYAIFEWDVASPEGLTLETSISYESKVKDGESWRQLALDESLLGQSHAVDGTPYGRLRLDIRSDVGADTYAFYCTKK